MTLDDAVNATKQFEPVSMIRMAVIDAHLRAWEPGYMQLPDRARLVVLDFAYQMGAPETQRSHRALLDALKDRNWQSAEAYCVRPKATMPRNDWARRQIQEIAENETTPDTKDLAVSGGEAIASR